MFFLRKLSILQLTVISASVLGISIIYLAYKNVGQSYSKAHYADQDVQVITLIAAVERVAHHHAVERGLTAGFLGDPSDDAKARVIAQREKADSAVATLSALLRNEQLGAINTDKIVAPLLEYAESKPEIRREVDNVNGKHAFVYYSTLNSKALSAASRLTLEISNSEAKQYLSHVLLFAQLKEKLGQRRGKVNGVLAKRSISSPLKNEIISYEDEIAYLSKKLKLNLETKTQSAFSTLLSNSNSQKIEGITQSILSDSVNFDLLPASSEWFSMASAQISDVANFLKQAVESVESFAIEQREDANFSLVLTFIVIVSVSIFLVLVYKALLSILHRQLSMLVNNLEKIANNGDLTIDIAMKTDNELGQISRSVNLTILALRDLIRGLDQSVAASSRLSGELESSCKSMLSDASNTQQLTTSIASAVEEISMTSREIAQSSFETLSASKELESLANESLDANEKVRATMDSLSNDMKGVQSNAAAMEQQVTEIGAILETINALSDQTNLLALNAAIEAARAGDHGRGFAVVADEVRQLAQRSRASSDKISGLLTSLQSASVIVVNDVNKNTEAVMQSVNISNEGRVIAEKVKAASINVEAMANNMSSAAEQQSITMQEVAKDVVEVEEAATHEVSIATELSALSEKMKENNLMLHRTMENFTID